MKRFLCWIRFHRPLIIEDSAFVDSDTKKMIFHARCACGKKYLTNSFNGWFGFRIERAVSKYFSKNIWEIKNNAK